MTCGAGVESTTTSGSPARSEVHSAPLRARGLRTWCDDRCWVRQWVRRGSADGLRSDNFGAFDGLAERAAGWAEDRPSLSGSAALVRSPAKASMRGVSIRGVRAGGGVGEAAGCVQLRVRRGFRPGGLGRSGLRQCEMRRGHLRPKVSHQLADPPKIIGRRHALSRPARRRRSRYPYRPDSSPSPRRERFQRYARRRAGSARKLGPHEAGSPRPLGFVPCNGRALRRIGRGTDFARAGESIQPHLATHSSQHLGSGHLLAKRAGHHQKVVADGIDHARDTLRRAVNLCQYVGRKHPLPGHAGAFQAAGDVLESFFFG